MAKKTIINVGKKRGPKPRGKVKIKWSPDFAYAIGLIATDGCLSNDGRHIDLTSKDKEQLLNYCKALKIDTKITYKFSASGQKYGRIQFGDIVFYNFLLSIGLTPSKSKTIPKLQIPNYYFDFLRGCFDGDGCFYSYFDPRWRNSFMFYVTFVSASKIFIDWIRKENKYFCGVVGHISKDGKGSTYQLKYAKKESLELIRKMYYNEQVICLSRKKKKILEALKISKIAQVEKLVNSLP